MTNDSVDRATKSAMAWAQRALDDEPDMPTQVAFAYRSLIQTYKIEMEIRAQRRAARIITNAHEAARRAAKKAQADG